MVYNGTYCAVRANRKGHIFVIRIISTFLFICLALNSHAKAQSACLNPVFGVSGISIDETAATANEAQQSALASAHQEAFATVLDRLLIPSIEELDRFVPEQFVELVHIRTENSLPGRYIAEIDICFSPQALRALFSENQWEWAEINSPLVLIMPVYGDGAGIRAWQESHPWIARWRKTAQTAQGLFQFTVLKPSLQNERQLRAEKIFKADSDVLQRAAKRAKAEQILWVNAFVSLVNDEPQLSMQALLFDKTGTQLANVSQSDLQGREAITGAAFDTFIANTIDRLETGWQKANVRRQGVDNQMTVRVRFTDHQDWIQKQVALAQLPAIDKLSTLMISFEAGDNESEASTAKPEAIVLLEMNGSIDALRYGLAPLGLTLSYSNENAVIE